MDIHITQQKEGLIANSNTKKDKPDSKHGHTQKGRRARLTPLLANSTTKNDKPDSKNMGIHTKEQNRS